MLGFDLAGNTFWEFKDSLNANRLRRIVRYGYQVHLADVNISRTVLPGITTAGSVLRK